MVKPTPTKVIDVFKTVLKWFLIILGVIQLIQIVFTLQFFGVIRNPFEAPATAPMEEKFYVSSFSPDSTKLYFEFADATRKARIGWMDLVTHRVSLFEPQDTLDQFASPSSSADGKRLAIIVKESAKNFETSQIGVLDIENRSYRVITNSTFYKQVPSFSRDGKKVIYAQANRIRESGKTRFSDWDIYETEIATGVEKRLTFLCFFSVSNPFYFDDTGMFLFSGEPSSCDHPTKSGVQGGSKNRKDFLAQYDHNNIFMMSGNGETLKPFIVNGADTHGAFLAREGKIFFISRTNEMDGIKCCNYNYDIFVYEKGVIKRLTDLKTALSGLVVSPKGDLASYISDPLRNHTQEYWMMDLNDFSHKQLFFGNSKLFQIVQVVNQR